MRTFDDALRLSFMFSLMLIALRFDGIGMLSEWPWWLCALISLLPISAYIAARTLLAIIGWFALTLRKLIWGR